MSRSARVVWDDALTSYDFGPGHPLAPVRVELTMALARELGVLDKVEMAGCAPATDDELALVHEPRLHRGRQARLGLRPARPVGAGSAPTDNPAFAGHARGVRAGRRAPRWPRPARSGRARPSTRSTSPAGCTTRCPARPAASASTTTRRSPSPGCCEQGVRASRLRRRRRAPRRRRAGGVLRRPAGADDQPAREPAHAVPRHRASAGRPAPRARAVNVALPAGSGDAGWLRAFDAVVPPLLREFRPEVLVTQHGCDSHALDPLAT